MYSCMPNKKKKYKSKVIDTRGRKVSKKMALTIWITMYIFSSSFSTLKEKKKVFQIRSAILHNPWKSVFVTTCDLVASGLGT